MKTDNEILTAKKVKAADSAKYLGIDLRTLYQGLQENKFPFGVAVKRNEWIYHIFAERLVAYKHGLDLINTTLTI